MNRLLLLAIAVVIMFMAFAIPSAEEEKPCTPQWVLPEDGSRPRIPLIHKQKDDIRFKRCGIHWTSDSQEEIFSIEMGSPHLFFIRDQIARKVGSFVGIMYSRMDGEWYEIKFKMPEHRGQPIDERIEYKKKIAVDQLPVTPTHEFIDIINSYFVATIADTEIITIYIKNHTPYCEAIKVWKKIIAVKEGI